MESYIKKILNELEESQEELDEMSVTGNLDGGEGPPKTPFAFGAGRKAAKPIMDRHHERVQKATRFMEKLE